MESEKLSFSLPEKKSRLPNGMIVFLLLVGIALAAANLYVLLTRSEPAAEANENSIEQIHDLAVKLDQRQLYGQAAEVWKEYAQKAKLTDVELAQAYFNAGVSLERAGRYAEAVQQFYQSEMAADVDVLASPIDEHVQTCFEKLGRFAALRYELMDRTSIEPDAAAGGKVVAEIGPEKITDADLTGLIERSVENQIQSYAAFMTPEQIGRQKQQMLSQFSGSKARQQFLQGYIAQELLYREALNEGLADEPQVKTMLDDVSRSVLGQEALSRQVAQNVHITETDLQTYYKANKDKYVEETADANDPNSTTSRQKPYEEVRQDIMTSLVSEKRNDVQQAYLEQLEDKYNVVVHTAAFAPAQEDESTK
jgi:hypothetical protein